MPSHAEGRQSGDISHSHCSSPLIGIRRTRKELTGSGCIGTISNIHSSDAATDTYTTTTATINRSISAFFQQELRPLAAKRTAAYNDNDNDHNWQTTTSFRIRIVSDTAKCPTPELVDQVLDAEYYARLRQASISPSNYSTHHTSTPQFLLDGGAVVLGEDDAVGGSIRSRRSTGTNSSRSRILVERPWSPYQPQPQQHEDHLLHGSSCSVLLGEVDEAILRLAKSPTPGGKRTSKKGTKKNVGISSCPEVCGGGRVDADVDVDDTTTVSSSTTSHSSYWTDDNKSNNDNHNEDDNEDDSTLISMLPDTETTPVEQNPLPFRRSLSLPVHNIQKHNTKKVPKEDSQQQQRHDKKKSRTKKTTTPDLQLRKSASLRDLLSKVPFEKIKGGTTGISLSSAPSAFHSPRWTPADSAHGNSGSNGRRRDTSINNNSKSSSRNVLSSSMVDDVTPSPPERQISFEGPRRRGEQHHKKSSSLKKQQRSTSSLQREQTSTNTSNTVCDSSSSTMKNSDLVHGGAVVVSAVSSTHNTGIAARPSTRTRNEISGIIIEKVLQTVEEGLGRGRRRSTRNYGDGAAAAANSLEGIPLVRSPVSPGPPPLVKPMSSPGILKRKTNVNASNKHSSDDGQEQGNLVLMDEEPPPPTWSEDDLRLQQHCQNLKLVF